jgi:hypothetical protein
MYFDIFSPEEKTKHPTQYVNFGNSATKRKLRKFFWIANLRIDTRSSALDQRRRS